MAVRKFNVAAAVVVLCVLAAVTTSVWATVAAPVTGRKHSPLLEDNTVPDKKPYRVTECQFGKQLKEIGSMWFADLGPPFGVMYCIKCECVQVQKKRRIIGRVQCRNIKNDCPKPNCEEPTLLPGKCCKSCPGEDAHDFVQDPPDEEEKSMKHFAAILTGQPTTKFSDLKKTDFPPSPLQELGLDYVATGRFTFYRKHLYFSFYTNRPDRPRMAQFIDTNGNIVEEIALMSGSVYQNLTRKVCGVWRRVSKDYKRLLREEKISVSLVWDTAIISGRLFRFRALDTEAFSSLLTGHTRDSGGTSIVSISTVSPSIHMQIMFNGPFAGQDGGSFLVKLKYAEGERAVMEETVRVDKPTANSSIVVELQSPVTFSDLNALSKRDLVVTVEAKQQPGFKLQGVVVPRVSCDIYQTLVVSNGHQGQDVKKDRTGGAAWAFINKDGALEYRVKFDNNAVTELAIVSGDSHVSALDLSESVVQTWANGTVSTMGPGHLEQLYAEELSLYSGPSAFKGRFTWRPVADARDTAGAMLLSSPEDRSVVGLLWITVDADCTLQYEVVLSGSNVKNRMFELYIEDSPFLIPGAPVFRRLLEEFEGPTLEGFTIGLSQDELSRLNTNIVHVDLWDPKLGQSILKTLWKYVNVPAVCYVRDPVDNDSNNILMNNDESSDHQQSPTHSSCLHGQKYYQHGAQWTSLVDECYMCNCHYGRVMCDVIVCPAVQCAVPPAKPATCCPTCEESGVLPTSTQNSSCSLAGQQFQAGSSWHPYLPPNGFDTCTLCHCNSTSLKIKCQRTDCPPLECDQRVAIRPTKRSCCKVCPSALHTTSKPTGPLVQLAQGDQQMVDGDGGGSDADVLSNGGCSYPVGGPYENGQEWHPKIYSHGEVKCINCKCKDGKVRCDRKKCPKWSSCSDPCCKSVCRRHKRQLFIF